MRRTRTFLAAVALVGVATLAGPATPALARGGGDGTTPPPAPTSPPLDCFAAPDVPDIAVNVAGDAGCVGVRVAASGLSLAYVTLADGWTYVVKSGGGTVGRVQLQFTQTATGRKVDFRMEPGKTVIG